MSDGNNEQADCTEECSVTSAAAQKTFSNAFTYPELLLCTQLLWLPHVHWLSREPAAQGAHETKKQWPGQQDAMQ